MPRINRIRISNVPYSGKHIVDQLINCYDGQNVLLNLANGGGKSVLTQMIMQPIIPNVKIHKRRVESYLTSKEPTFIMLEWLLDNTPTPTYFLTGIVMNRAITEENNYRVKYFTFVNEYKASNAYDIKNIDFISNVDGMIKYKSYDYCLSELRKREGNQLQIETFTIDEQKGYSQILEERGIFKDEWKILAKINEKEGGIDDLFEKCEKSNDVINQWILKTISEKLENADDLREMFLNLMIDVMNHEDEIKQKEELEKFKVEADNYIIELSKLLENMNKQEEIKKELEEIFLKLNTCVHSLEQKDMELRDRINEKSNALAMIEYEELSEGYYKFESGLEEKTEEEEKKSKELADLETKKQEAVIELNIIRAAKIYEEYKEAKAEREAALVAKQRLEEKLTEDNIKDIEYSLKIEYDRQVNRLEEEINKFKSELEQLTNECTKLKNEQKSSKFENTEITNKLAVVLDRVNRFKEAEERILSELNLELIRNMLGELDKKEIEKIISNYEEIEKKAESQIKHNMESIKNNCDKIEANIKEIEKIDSNLEENIVKIGAKEKEIVDYETKTEELKRILQSFAIDVQNLFDKQTNLNELERQREFADKRKVDNTELLNQNKQLLEGLKSGGIHVDLKIGSILKRNKIEYETGEEYLTGQTHEYQEKLLGLNPILPYSYIILNDKDYEKIEDLMANEEINRLTPIILRKDIERDFKPKNKVISLIDSVKLQCLYNTKAFDEELKRDFQRELEERVEELKNKVKEDENKLADIRNAINFVKEYKYDVNDKEILKEELKGLKEQSDNLKLRKKEIERENNDLTNENGSINEKIFEIRNLVAENKNNKDKFDAYLLENEAYMKLLKEKQELENKLNGNEVKLNELEGKISENEINQQSAKGKISNNESYKKELEERRGRIPNIEQGQKLDKTLEELEEIYQEISNKILKNEQEIKRRIDTANSRMISKDKELKKEFSGLEEKYEEKKYVEEEEDFAKDRTEELDKELKYVKDEKDKVSAEKLKLETKLENINDNLKKLGKNEPMQAYLIKGEYDKRRQELKKQVEEINAELSTLKVDLDLVKENRVYVRTQIVQEPEIRKVDISNFDYHNTNIKELAKQLKDKKEENDNKRRFVDDLYRSIEGKNLSENQAIRKFLNNMNPYQNGNEFANYYFTYERVTECSKSMEQMIQLLKTTIANIENDKKNIKHHAYVQGKNIYLEMKEISDSTDIRMPGKLRKVPLLEIELPKELDQFAEERVSEYIEQCINNLREECSEQENIRQIVEKRIKEWLTDRQLLNYVINTENIGVKLYKIDISDKNSGLRNWEEVVVDNSGGEKLVSCLVLVLALMQYTRKKVLAKYGNVDKLEISKFLIIDNPFGKMSSTHLLNGLMLILDRFNVQAICLSDISQSSITNQFKVIYQLSLKSGKYTDKIYLTADNVIKSPELAENYLLEQAYIRSEAQQKMWL